MTRIVAWLFLAASAAFASSTTITIVPAGAGPGAIPTAMSDRNAWILSTFGPGWNPQILESFESFGFGPYNSLSTGAGTLSVMPGSQPGDYWQSNGTKTDQFTILNSSDTPFSGRFNTTAGGNNWLDSNDITQIQLTTSLSTLFFFITDVNDIGGMLTIKTADGTSSSGFAPNAADGNLYFVGIHSSGPIGSVQWLNNSNNDGWGVDDFGTAVDPPPPPYRSAAPEPSSWPFAAAALVAIAAIRKYRARAYARIDRSSEPSA